jgi:Fe2+ or Zn2+ uptake regulation protein
MSNTDGGGTRHQVRAYSEHIHLACLQCGRIEESLCPAFDQLRRAIGDRSHFEIQIVLFEAGGRCRDCRRRKASQSTK